MTLSPEPEQSGSFLLLRGGQVLGPLTFTGRNECQRDRTGLAVVHCVDEDFFENQIWTRLRANLYELLQAVEEHSDFGVVGRVGADEHRLADRICRLVHKVTLTLYGKGRFVAISQVTDSSGTSSETFALPLNRAQIV